MNIQKVPTEQKDDHTGLPYYWELSTATKKYAWQGFYTGPLVLDEKTVAHLCKKLLDIELSELTNVATLELQPVPSLKSVGASIILHSTTPDLKTFDGDLDKVMKGITPTDYTSYKEARAVYLASPGDLAVGRIQPWKAGVRQGALESVELPGIDYYYLSHALLVLAEQHLEKPRPQIDKILTFIKERENAVVRLYALEKEMQIFLIWLKRLAGLDRLLMDANSPEVARDWNRKSVLFPTVKSAVQLKSIIKGLSPYQILEEEAKHSLLRQRLGCKFPVLPGYTIVRTDNSLAVFTKQLLNAAMLLQKRYGLTLGCLKAADSGDGARITPGIDLDDTQNLEVLAKDAYRHGDDYILEPHIYYDEVEKNSEKLKANPSAHIRWGEVAPGLTLQFMEGTSWKGNIYLDKHNATDFGVSKKHYHEILDCMNGFRSAFHNNHLGLTMAGLDFAIGRIGGHFGEETLIGVQDPNISFNGAECLRVFLEKIRKQAGLQETESLYGATRIFKPSKECTLPVLNQAIKTNHAEVYTDTIATIPSRWAMIAVAHQHPDGVMLQLEALLDKIREAGLVQN